MLSKDKSMKKLLLICMLTAYCTHAGNIPSLNSLLQAQHEFIKNVSPNSSKLDKEPTTKDVFNMINLHFIPNEVTPERIEDTLMQWYNENPTLFRGTMLTEVPGVPTLHNLPSSLTDAFLKESYKKEYLSPAILSDPNLQSWFKKVENILKVLKKLGIAQMLSDEQIHNMAKINAADTEAVHKFMASGFMQEVEKAFESQTSKK